MSHAPLIRAMEGPTGLDRFLSLPYTLNHELADDLSQGRRRTDWMWMAITDDRVVARVAWWGNPGDDEPSLLDIFDIADPADPAHRSAARDLLETATRQVIGNGSEPPGYIRYVPSDWRDNEAVRHEVEALIDVAEQTGARVFVERLRFEWREQTPIATPSGRLDFRQPHDDDEILGLMTSVVPGSLDAHTVLDLKTMTPREAATEHFYGELAQQISPTRQLARRDQPHRRPSRLRDTWPQPLPPGHRLPRRLARASRQRLHPRPTCHWHTRPRRPGRRPYPRRYRPHQPADGRGVRTWRMDQLRAVHQHDVDARLTDAVNRR